MIGWIALAGIIVRNSILLVDFSIHQVQQGTSVVDSVIMACKTRTRPIMITAFALVCGSSVIFFRSDFPGHGHILGIRCAGLHSVDIDCDTFGMYRRQQRYY